MFRGGESMTQTMGMEVADTDFRTDRITGALRKWNNLPNQKVKLNTIELQPFQNWSPSPTYKSPDWWRPYNGVKHERLENFRKANLKNVANALAGLYVLELYLIKFPM